MPTRRTFALAFVLTAVVCDYVGVTMMRVALPFYAQSLGGAGTLVGSLESTYGLGQWVGAASVPRWSDTWGRKGTLLVCLLCSALGYSSAVLSLWMASPWLLVLSRFPVGFAKQAVTVSRAIVADCTDANEERSRWMSFLGTALAVGCSLGPILGSQAADRFGEAAPVAAAAAAFAAFVPAVAWGLPETRPTAERSRKPDGDEAATANGPALWRVGRFAAALAVLALPELGLVAHQGVTLNTFAVHHLRLGKVWVANLNAASALMQAIFAGAVCTTLAKRGWGDVLVLQLGAASFAAASLAIWCGQSPAALVASAAPAAFANAVLRSIPPSFLSKRAPRHQQGEAMGLLDVGSSALRVLAPAAAGACMDHLGGGAVFLGQAALFGAAGLGLLRAPPEAPAEAAGPPGAAAPAPGGGAAAARHKRD